MILLWGAAHISVAWDYSSVPFLFLVFAIEKVFYVVHWIKWLRRRDRWIDAVKDDFLANGFFHLYGLPDVFFGAALFAIFILGLL